MPRIQDTCTFRFDGLRGGLNVQALALAVAIADQAARADIEIYAESRWVDGLRFFDCMFDAASDPEAVQKFEAVSRALAYIDARGDVFPWHIKRHIAHAGWVHFEDKIGDDHSEPH
jgi:hypothetical protein